MSQTLRRRDFLKGSAAFAGAAAAGFTCVEIARAAPIEMPVVDKLTMWVLIDSSHDLFFRPSEVGGVSVRPAPRPKDYRQILHNQWGLSLFLESEKGAERRAIMLDFGYSPEALLNNIDITGVDPSKLQALVVSHGHYDHFGGLDGFLKKYRAV